MDRIQISVETCAGTAGAAASNSPGDGGASAASAEGADPEIAIAGRAARPPPVALYWHGLPGPDAAAAALALAATLGPVQVLRVILPAASGAAGSAARLPRSLARAGAELLLSADGGHPRALAEAWHAVVVDDLVRHPVLATVVLAGPPAPVHARLAPMLRAARVRPLWLRQPVSTAVVPGRLAT